MSALKKHPLAIAGAVLAIAAVASSSAFAGSEHDHSAGMRVVRDPVTGQLRAPTHEEFKAMQDEEKARAAKAPARAPASIAPRSHPSGARGARMTDESMSHTVLMRQPDGSLLAQCFGSHEEAQAALKAQASIVLTNNAPTE